MYFSVLISSELAGGELVTAELPLLLLIFPLVAEVRSQASGPELLRVL